MRETAGLPDYQDGAAFTGQVRDLTPTFQLCTRTPLRERVARRSKPSPGSPSLALADVGPGVWTVEVARENKLLSWSQDMRIESGKDHAVHLPDVTQLK